MYIAKIIFDSTIYKLCKEKDRRGAAAQLLTLNVTAMSLMNELNYLHFVIVLKRQKNLMPRRLVTQHNIECLEK